MIDLAQCVSRDGSQVYRRVFRDQAVYELEREYIFGRNWLYLCHESQLANPGDYVRAYMCDTPIIVSRGDDGNIHAMVNSCSHRGLPVCRSDSGNAKRFVCPYHNWSYRSDGSLAAIPQDRKLGSESCKSALGLKKVPRVASYEGLIFGCFDERVESLDDYLGDMKFYLDSLFRRFDAGIEVVGQPLKWSLSANWKLPVENQLGDVAHGPFLHNSLLGGTDSVKEIDDYGLNCVPRPGHGAAVRLMPEDSDDGARAWGLEGIAALSGNAEYREYLLERQAMAEECIGKVGARIKGLTYGVYPNLSLLWSNSTLRVSHPRGPGEIDYWSWWLLPKDAPEGIRKLLRSNFTLMFGPGGLLEQEDGEAWSQQYNGVNISYMDDSPLHYGLGQGSEGPHPELPGQIGSCYSEHYARAFYQRWRQDIENGLRRAGA